MAAAHGAISCVAGACCIAIEVDSSREAQALGTFHTVWVGAQLALPSTRANVSELVRRALNLTATAQVSILALACCRVGLGLTCFALATTAACSATCNHTWTPSATAITE